VLLVLSAASHGIEIMGILKIEIDALIRFPVFLGA